MTAARRYPSMLRGLGPVLVVAALAGCTAVASPDATDSAPVATVGAVGELPASLSTEAPTPTETDGPDTGTVAPTEPSSTSTSTTVAVPQTIGSQAAGNRLLIIGDSVTASVSQRYGGEACNVLVPLGWKVEVDAETGKFIDFAKLVFDKRLDAGWDAAVIFLGNNYGYKKDVYQAYLHALLLRLVPRPTVLITTSLFRPQQQDVNDVIHEEAAMFQSVTVIDWTTISQDPSLTGKDNLHLTEKGRNVLAFYLGTTMGAAPAQPGQCLKTSYTDDRAGSPDGPPGNQTGTKTTVPRPTTTTVKPTATTTAGASSTVKTGDTTAGTSTTVKTGTTTATTAATSTSTAPTPVPTTAAPATTAAPTTAAPTTAAAATTAAPTTAAPTTAAATTAAPTTAAPVNP